MFQKLFSIFFAYIIGFQLVVGAIPHHALNSSAWAQGSCSSGLQWNEMLGRCVTTAQAAELADASKMCETKGDDAAKKQCYRDVIEGKMKDANVKEAGKINKNTISIVLAMASLLSAAMFLITGAGDCPTTGAWLIVGSAMAVIAGEYMSASKYDSALEKAKAKFKTVTAQASNGSTSDNSNATSAQAEAFQAMIEMEEATISAAKTKNMLYMVATAGYAAATVLSTIETFTYNADFITQSEKVRLTCWKTAVTTVPNSAPLIPGQIETPSFSKSAAEIYVDNYFQHGQRVSFGSYLLSSSTPFDSLVDLTIHNKEIAALQQGAYQGTSLDEYHSAKKIIENHFISTSKEEVGLMQLASTIAQQFTISSAQAAAPVAANLAAHIANLSKAAGVGKEVVVAKSAGMKKLYMTPMSRAILAGVMTVNNLFMISHTNKQKKNAEERKAFIEKLKAQVEAAGAAFGCANSDRNDLSKPNCYCYSEGGALNPARSNSATCKSLFGAKPSLANKTNNPTGVSNQRNCVNRSGALDASCGCRANNTCVSVNSPRVIGNVPVSKVLGSIPPTVDGINNGSISPADINPQDMIAAAARLKKMNEMLINDPKNKKAALLVKDAKAKSEQLMDDMARSLASTPALASSSSGSGLLNASSPTAAIEEMKKELSQQIKGYEGNSVPVAGGGQGRKGDDFSLDALSGNGGVTVSDEQLADAANSLDMTAAEINSDSSANIFSILSNRYQRSGMRRLFGGETVIEADKPTGTDINQ